jgi:hypothetical protein
MRDLVDIHQRLLQFVDGHMSIVLADFADDKFGDVRRKLFAKPTERMGVLGMLIAAAHKSEFDLADFANIFVNVRASAIRHHNPYLSVDDHLLVL